MESKNALDAMRIRHEKRIESDKKRKLEQFESERKSNLHNIHELAEEAVDISRYRNERSIMALPLFSTKCARRTSREVSPMCHEITTPKGTKRFTVTPDPLLGMPDEVDANILRFAISKGREIRHRKGYFPDYIDTTRYELCDVLGLGRGGNQYRNIIERLERLEGVRFKGNIFSFNEKDIYGGPLITYRYLDESSAQSPIRIEFTLSFRKHLEQEAVCLTIPNEIMTMQSALQIRLTELVRLRMGNGVSWVVGLSKLRRECSAEETALKKFKYYISKVKLSYAVDFSKEKRLAEQKVRFSKVPLSTTVSVKSQ